MNVPAVDFIAADRLTCSRAGRVVFGDLTLRARSGQLVVIEGANGSGKTSLLRLLAGLLEPTEGSIVLKAEDVEHSDAEERRRFVGWLGHQDAVKPQMTPAETVRFFARLHGSTGNSSDPLKLVGLKKMADLPCQYLSAGQKKRLALARLQVLARPLWLLDEPLAALDSEGKVLFTSLVTAHLASGGIAIMATHEPIEVPSDRLRLS